MFPVLYLLMLIGHKKQFEFLKKSAESEDGYSGRIGIHEVLTVTPTIRELILKGSSQDDIEIQAKKEGMMTMLEDGVFQAVLGLISLEEIFRVVSE